MVKKRNLFSKVSDIQRTGSDELRNYFLQELKSEIFRLTAIYCKKAGREPTDEAFLVALHAVNQAIDQFDEKRGASFETYISTVISSRLTDFFREERRLRRKFVAYNHENLTIISDRKTSMEYRTHDPSEDLWDELMRLYRILSNVGYTWKDVVKNKPTHQDSRKNLLKIAIHICKSGLGERYIKENPLSRELTKLIGVNRRTLKKYRPYLCALVATFTYDFPVIRSYLTNGKAELLDEESQRDRC